MSLENRWDLVLGSDKEKNGIELSTEEKEIEDLLSKVYSNEPQQGFGRSSHKIRKWLDGIRTHFNPEVVSLMQKDALERQGVQEMLLEPELLEKIEPDVQMVANILSLQSLLPEKTSIVARQLVDKLVKKIEEKLRTKIINAVRTAQKGKSKIIKPKLGFIDWKRTIGYNLRNYDASINAIIPKQWFGYKSGSKLKEVYLLVDKSGSMIDSAIHAAIIGSVLASIPSIETHVVFFDTEISDLTGKYQDPVDILFSVPMGGGTDIGLAISYIDQKIRSHSDSIIFLISDLDEGGSPTYLMNALASLISKKTLVHCILSLSEEGNTEYNQSIASKILNLGIPVYGSDPENFPEILCKELNKLY